MQNSSYLCIRNIYYKAFILNMGKKLTTADFIKKAREVHGDKYDYSKVNYVNAHTKVCIICPEHGEFWQTPNSHLSGNGCPKCSGNSKSNTFEFINKAREVHGKKYDYSKVKYVNSQTKVRIICPKHGEFLQTPNMHLMGIGCPKCAGSAKLNTNEFIKKAREIHGNKYNYSKVNYVNSYTKVCIICPEHGEFWQVPNSHLKGIGCPNCGIESRKETNSSTTEEFIKKARKIHGDKYDYSKVEYLNSQTKVRIICPEHGEFLQTPANHLSGKGCPKCGGKIKFNTNEFINKAREVHGNKYDYSKVKYVDNKTKVRIICPEHGEFWQTPASHLSGEGCPNCSGNAKLNTIEFIEKAREIHGDKYDYSKVEYLNSQTKVRIICPKHGEFLQTPNVHLNGVGCPKCNSSKLELEIRLMLDEQGIKYNYRERKIPWLKGLELDFYISDKNIAIECQGMQHFKPIEYFGGEETYKYTIENDSKKRKLCEENGLKLLYYSNLGIEYPYKVFENKEELLKEILNS